MPKRYGSLEQSRIEAAIEKGKEIIRNHGGDGDVVITMPGGARVTAREVALAEALDQLAFAITNDTATTPELVNIDTNDCIYYAYAALSAFVDAIEPHG